MINSFSITDLQKRKSELDIRCDTLNYILDNYPIRDHQRNILKRIIEENINELGLYGVNYTKENKVHRKITIQQIRKYIKNYLLEIHSHLKQHKPLSSIVFQLEQSIDCFPTRSSILEKIGEKDILVFLIKHKNELELLFPQLANDVKEYLHKAP